MPIFFPIENFATIGDVVVAGEGSMSGAYYHSVVRILEVATLPVTGHISVFMVISEDS